MDDQGLFDDVSDIPQAEADALLAEYLRENAAQGNRNDDDNDDLYGDLLADRQRELRVEEADAFLANYLRNNNNNNFNLAEANVMRNVRVARELNDDLDDEWVDAQVRYQQRTPPPRPPPSAPPFQSNNNDLWNQAEDIDERNEERAIVVYRGNNNRIEREDEEEEEEEVERAIVPYRGIQQVRDLEDEDEDENRWFLGSVLTNYWPRVNYIKFQFTVTFWQEDEEDEPIEDSVTIGYSPVYNFRTPTVTGLYPPIFQNTVLYSTLPQFPAHRRPHPLAELVLIRRYYDMVIQSAGLAVHYYTSLNPGAPPVRLNMLTIIVKFWNEDTLHLEYRSIPFPLVRTYADFQDSIAELIENSGVAEGLPEEYGLENCELDTSFVGIIFVNPYRLINPGIAPSPAVPNPPQNFAMDSRKSAYMIYHTMSHSNSGNLGCIYLALKDCGYEIEEMKNNDVVEDMVDLIRRRNLPIDVIFNIPDFTRDDFGAHRCVFPQPVKLGKRKSRKMYPLRDEHVGVRYCYRTTLAASATIVFDKERSHVEAISTLRPNIRDGVYMDDGAMIVRVTNGKAKIVRDWKNMDAPKTRNQTVDDTLFIPFDFECVSDFSKDNFGVPYSCSAGCLSFEDLKELDRLDKLECNGSDLISMGNLLEIEEFMQDRVDNLVGFDCVDRFISWVEQVSEANPDHRIVLLGFNNSTYDNFFLLAALLRINRPFYDKPIDFVTYHGTNRLADIMFCQKRATTFDLRRHLVGSLAANCKSFGVKNFKKMPELISHLDVQEIYNKYGEDGFFQNFPIDLADLEEYNNRDVTSLAVIFYRYYINSQTEAVKTAHEIDPNFSMNVYDHCSLPGMVYGIHKRNMKKNGIAMPALTFNQYTKMKEGARAGRIETGMKPQNKIEEEIVSQDVCSQYPYAMMVAPVDYPCGSIEDGLIEANDEVILRLEWSMRHNFTKLGFYTVNIDQSNLRDVRKPLIVCYKGENGNNYGYDDNVVYQSGVFLCTADILLLLDYGCFVELVVGARKILFTGRVSAFDLFGWMAPLMQEKNRLDDIKAKHGEKSELYNGSRRELMKLIMNSISGKVIQRPYVKVVRLVNKMEYLSGMIVIKDMVPDSLTIVGEASPSLLIVSYKVEPESVKNIHEVQVGAYIYAYSRAHLYRFLLFPLGMDNILYVDTDSAKCLKRIWEWLRPFLAATLVPHNLKIRDFDPRYGTSHLVEDQGKVFGQFDNELKKNTVSYINDKKEYGVFDVNAETGEVITIACGLKGVGRGAVPIDLFDPTVQGFVKIDKRMHPIYDHYNQTTTNRKEKLIVNQAGALKFDIESGKKDDRISNPKVLLKVFDDLIEGRDVYFLNTAFIRSIEHTTVRVIYTVKRLLPGKRKLAMREMDMEN